MNNTQTKSAFITLIGSPNAGKSTLLNRLVGSKVAIVTPKVQTTRSLINGICMYENAQLVFIDTPGIFKPKQKLEKEMVKIAWGGLREADFVSLIIDCKKGLTENTLDIIKNLKDRKIKCQLIFNKIDLVKKEHLLQLIEQCKGFEIFENIFMVSALKGDGVEQVKKFFTEKAPIGPWLYDPEDITTLPKRFLAAEIVREQLFMKLNEELPYNLAVETEQWEELADGSAKVHQVIYTTRDAHKKIIIGKHGLLLKTIGQDSRLHIEQILGQKVHLFLFVKVRENWPDYYKSIY